MMVLDKLRDSYRDDQERKLAHWASELQLLRSKADALERAVRRDFEKEINQLGRLCDRSRALLEQLRRARPWRWRGLRGELQATGYALRRSLEKARRMLSERDAQPHEERADT